MIQLVGFNLKTVRGRVQDGADLTWHIEKRPLGRNVQAEIGRMSRNWFNKEMIKVFQVETSMDEGLRVRTATDSVQVRVSPHVAVLPDVSG